MARSFLNYEDARVRNLIRAFKFECISSLDEILNPLMAEGFEHFFKNKPIDHMIPVPLHKSRKKEREFNQAELLCRGIEESCSIKAATDVVVRNRMTVPQVKMSPQKRKANLHGAFTIKIPDRIHGKRILLVDDVFTTGSTVNEISLTLKQAGAKMVMVYTLARAGLF